MIHKTINCRNLISSVSTDNDGHYDYSDFYTLREGERDGFLTVYSWEEMRFSVQIVILMDRID